MEALSLGCAWPAQPPVGYDLYGAEGGVVGFRPLVALRRRLGGPNE